MSAVDAIGSFEDYLVKQGKTDEAKTVKNGVPNGANDSPAVTLAKEKDIFTAEKMYSPGSDSGKETAGASAASSSGGGFVSSVVHGAANFVMANLDIDGAPPIPGVAPSVAGDAPLMASALQQPSGGETPDGQGGAATGDPNSDVMDLYNQYLDELNQAEILDEEGGPAPVGDGMLTPEAAGTEGPEAPIGADGTEGTDGVDTPPEADTPPEPDEVEPEPNKEETSSDINKQQEKQLLQEQAQKQLEEQQRQSRFFNRA